jgi:exodeoxyribonuclease-5
LSITLTNDQARAFGVIEQISGSERGHITETCVVQGCAGTGKTTLIREVVAKLGQSVILAPTGKAALRVREATGQGATTIHKWMYKPIEDDETGEITFVLKHPDELARPESGIIIVDEASMVDMALHDAIITMADALGVNVLFLGDNAQLPPVAKGYGGGPPFNILDELTYRPTHRVELHEIVRQAAGDPIIETATLIRTNKMFKALTRLPCIQQADLIPEALATIERGGAVICWKNQTRHWLNRELRAARGAGATLEEDEPLLVLKNDYVVNVFNGEVVNFNGWVNKPRGPFIAHNHYQDPPDNSQNCLYGQGLIRTSEGEAKVVVCHEEIMGQLLPKITPSAVAACGKRARNRSGWDKDVRVIHASLGYALTCHKAQGSEWPEVLIVLDGVNTATQDGRRWIYTAVTRSKKTVRLCVYE